MILIGMGGNLASPRFGSPLDTLAAALMVLQAESIRVITRSAWYRTEPVPPSEQPWFINAVASVATHLTARDLLAVLQTVEEHFGRVRSERNAPRVLDLDLLDYQGQVTDTASLVLPHPRLHQRQFVLLPLAEIAPDWCHPLSKLTAKQLLSRMSTTQVVERLPC